jgi:hypothetical protein
MTLYGINATATHHTTDKDCVSATVTYQIPTFYLNADVQGIVDEQHAAKIARDIICPMADALQYESVTITVTAVKV